MARFKLPCGHFRMPTGPASCAAYSDAYGRPWVPLYGIQRDYCPAFPDCTQVPMREDRTCPKNEAWHASRSKAHGQADLVGGAPRLGKNPQGLTTLARNGLAPFQQRFHAFSQRLVASRPESNFFRHIEGFGKSRSWLAQTKSCISWYTEVICNCSESSLMV